MLKYGEYLNSSLCKAFLIEVIYLEFYKWLLALYKVRKFGQMLQLILNCGEIRLEFSFLNIYLQNAAIILLVHIFHVLLIIAAVRYQIHFNYFIEIKFSSDNSKTII